MSRPTLTFIELLLIAKEKITTLFPIQGKKVSTSMQTGPDVLAQVFYVHSIT